MTEAAPFVCAECSGKRRHRRRCPLDENGGLIKPAVAVHILDGYIERLKDDPDSAEQIAHAKSRRKELSAGL